MQINLSLDTKLLNRVPLGRNNDVLGHEMANYVP